MKAVESRQAVSPSLPPARHGRKRHPLRRALVIALAMCFIIVLLGLTVISTLTATQPGSRWVLNKVIAGLNDEGRSLAYGSAEGTLLGGMTLHDLRYQESDNSIRAGRLELAWSPSALLARSLNVDRILVNDLTVTWHSADTVPSEEPFSDPLADILPLPVAITIHSATLRNATIDIDGTVQQVAALQLTANLQQQELVLSGIVLDSDLVGVQGELDATLASPYPLHANLQWRWQQLLSSGAASAQTQAPTLTGAQGALQLTGDLNNLIINHQLQTPLLMNSDGNAVLDLFPQGNARPQAFSIVHQLPPQTIPLVSAEPTRSVRIDDAEFTTSGWLEALHVTGLASLRLLDDTGANLAPAIGLSWNTLVNTQGLELQQLSASTASGSFSSSGNIRWSDGLEVNLDYSVREDDASQYQALLPAGLEPGALTSSGSISLQSGEDDYTGSIAVDSLQGELNGYPLTGGGSVDFGNNEYRLNGISLRSTDNLLRLNGQWAETVDLNWELQAPNLGTLSSLLDGVINASGNIAGTPEQLRLELTAQGEALSWDDIRIGQLQLNGDYVDGQNNLHLNVSNIALAEQRISSLQVNLTGQPGDHRGSANLASDIVVAQLAFNGALTSGETLLWAGNLRDGQLRSELGSWVLQDTVAMTAAADAISIASHCWHQQAGAVLCLDGNWNDNQLAANARLSELALGMFNAPSPQQQEAEFPPSLIPRLPAGTTLDGSLSADVNVSGDTTDLARLALRFSMNADSSSITITPPDSDVPPDVSEPPTQEQDTESSPQRFDWPVARLSGSHEDGQWRVNGDLNFRQPDIADTGISAQGNAHSQLFIGADGVLDGVVDIGFEDLSWLEAFVPQIEELEGSLRGQTRISGTLDQPLLGGNLSLLASSLEIPTLGVQITNLDAAAFSANGRDFTLSGTANSGDGYLRFDSELQEFMSESRSLSLALNGENFELLNRPELHLVITPQLDISSSDSGVNASGSILLPIVDARPVALPESALDVSRDTVLVGQPEEAAPVRNAAQGNRGILDDVPLTAQIQVILGDEVRFSGFGLTAHLSGELDITQRATGAPLAYGELAVLEGSYSTYGRSLEIEHGKLLFFGSIDNPALDIRAVRETRDIRVGVQMNGTLRNIRSQLFSTPTLPDGDIIAVLLTDRPFAEIGNEDSNALVGAITNLGINQGQSLTNQIRNQLGLDTLAITSGGGVTNSSLTFGKYLTPRLFLRYGIGLFETESTLAVDYTISDRVKLEAQSGNEQSVDLTYTVER